MFKKYFLPTLALWLLRSLVATWKKDIYISAECKKALEEGTPLILAHWHGDELALLSIISRFKLCTMTSTSKDGQIMNHVLNKLGLKTSRGSSTRGGSSALRGLVRLIQKEKRHATMAVDGPRGPIYEPKPGVFEIAKLTKGRVTPMAARCLKAKVFSRSWNQAFLPYPFSRVSIVIGAPWPVLDRKDNVKSPEMAQKLKHDIDAARQQAEERVKPS